MIRHIRPFHVRLAIWSIVCIVSAAPSFFWGASLFNHGHEIAAMITGVAIFIALYTWISGTPFAERLLRNPHLRLTFRIGYGTRLGMSIIFPIAIYADMITGIFAVGLTGVKIETSEPFLPILMTTLVQGCFLNGLLAIYMAVVYGIIRVIRGRPVIETETSCACGYDLRAGHEVCPECGMPVPARLRPITAATLPGRAEHAA